MGERRAIFAGLSKRKLHGDVQKNGSRNEDIAKDGVIFRKHLFACMRYRSGLLG
jgi:hypothetical protein